MKRRRKDQGGFAMLLVFLMAAMIAISLYMEIPRVSFESQRAKEELLIERGDQYKRAIKVFVRANHRYPSTIEEMESFNNHRYLRKRYIDPMTGKKEWRLVHIGAGGMLTDSLVQKPPTDADKDKDKTQSTQNFGPGGANPAGQVGMPGMPGQPGMYPQPGQPGYGVPGYGQPGQPGQPGAPSAVPRRRDSEMAGLIPGGAPGQPGYTGQPQIDPATGQPITTPGTGTTPGQPGMTGLPGQPYPTQPGMPALPGQPYPGMPGQTTGLPGQQPMPGQPGYTGQQQYPYSTQPGAQGTGAVPFQQPGMSGYPGAPAGGATDAQKMIQNLLTQPRPAALGSQTAPSGIGQTIGGGIAGVASLADDEGIKIYHDQTNYKEWEFIYDYTKDAGPAGQQGSNLGTPAGQLGTQPGQQPGVPGSQPTSGFGQSSTGFGQSGPGTPQMPPTVPQQ